MYLLVAIAQVVPGFGSVWILSGNFAALVNAGKIARLAVEQAGVQQPAVDGVAVHTQVCLQALLRGSARVAFDEFSDLLQLGIRARMLVRSAMLVFFCGCGMTNAKRNQKSENGGVCGFFHAF